ncbi:EamA family transporter [filamentous cyanobacterium CCP2]|nr:EamA family transporter [filamentous cyanobacterium CCP2]
MNNSIKAPVRARFGLISIMLSATLWGTAGIFAQVVYNLVETNPLSIGFFRLALSVPLLLTFCCATLGRQMFQIARRDLVIMLGLGGVVAAYQVLYLAAIPQIGVAAATLITLCTAPVWVAVFAFLLLRERLTARVMGAGSCAIVGTVLLVGVQPTTEVAPVNVILGIGMALASALCYALMLLCSRPLSRRYHPLQPLTVSFTVGAILLFPIAGLSGLVIDYPIQGWACLLYLGIIPTAFAYLLYFSGIRYTSATVASILTLLEPLTATLLAWWLLGERLGTLGLMGAVLLIGAIGLLTMESLRQHHST